MKTLVKILIITLCVALHNSCATLKNNLIAGGQQPQLAMDHSGTIRMVYGQGDKIYCATSINNGVSFPDIQVVGEVKAMHLGMTRGPQVASSKKYSLIAAIDKAGDIHTFKLTHASGKWVATGVINDVSGSAPEGLMSITADAEDHFYAVWLDTRNDQKNKICFAASTGQENTWQRNQIVYTSPEQSVCECCKPTIAADRSEVAIMFRNWLNGSRDLYVTQLDRKTATFNTPVKLGNGTWKLNGCPMDGGGLVVSDQQGISTVWQREGTVYYAKPNAAEQPIGKGRNCSITDPDHPIITWQDGLQLKLKELDKSEAIEVGAGGFLKAIRTKNGRIFYAWEQEKNILFKSI